MCLVVCLTGLYLHAEFYDLIGERWPVKALRPVRSLPKEGDSSSVDVETRAAIIKVALERMTKKDHAVTDDGRVYLVVSEELYKRLPRSVNDIKIERYTGPTYTGENDVPYIVFNGWVMEGNSVLVTQIAYFVGGNTGGCHERYTYWEVGGWKVTSSECFASAS